MAKRILKATQNRAVVALVFDAAGSETIDLQADIFSSGQLVDGATQTVDISAISISVQAEGGKVTIERNSELVWVGYGAQNYAFNGYTLNRQNTSDIVVTATTAGTVILELAKTGGYTATIPNVGISGAW